MYTLRLNASVITPISYFLLASVLVLSWFHTRSATAKISATATTVQPCTSSITIGDTMACSISAAAETNTISFSGTKGDAVLVRVGATAGTLTPRIRLVGPDSVTLCQTGTSYAAGAEITECLLTQTGMQSIIVADYNGNRVGSYSLYIQRLTGPVGAAPLTMNSIATTSLTTAATANSFTFAAARNDSVLLRASTTAGSIMPLVRVFGSNGAVICNAGSAYSRGIEISRCVLPFDGMYTVLVADYRGTETGTVNLYAQHMNNPVGTTALTTGTTQPATIQTAAEADTYNIVAPASSSVFIRIGTTAGNMIPLVRVLDANGVALCTAGTAYSSGAEISRCLLPQSGTYTVLVSDYSGTETGSYNLYLQSLTTPADATPLTIGTTVAGTLQAAATMHTYTVDGRADDILLLRVGRSDGAMIPFIAIYDPDGVRLCAGGTAYSAGAEISRCALPRDGRYTVLVGDFAATKPGHYQLYSQRLNRPPEAIKINNGDNLSATIQSAAEADTYMWVAGDHDTLNMIMTRTSGALIPQIRIFDPAGTLVCQAGAAYSPTATLSACLLPRSGVYTILTMDLSATQTGAYRLSLGCSGTTCGGGDTTQASQKLYLPLTIR